MSDCLDNAQCSPVASQAFPAPLPEGIPADSITYAFEGICPEKSGLDQCNGTPITVSQALDLLEGKLCALNPRGIASAPDCSPVVIKGGVATPVTALQALNCLPKSNAGDVPQFNGAEWIVGPILKEVPDCIYPCPPAPNLILTSTGVNTATWQSANPPTLSGLDTTTAKTTVTPTSVKVDVTVDPIGGNALQSGPNGLSVIVPPIACADLALLLNPNSATTCYPNRFDSPALVLSTGPSGIGYRSLPVFTDATTVSNTSSVSLSLSANNVSAIVNIDPAVTNRLSIGASGLVVPPIECSDLSPLLDPSSATTCYPNKTDSPALVLSTGSSGIGYRSLPPATAPTIVLGAVSPGIRNTVTSSGSTYTVTPTIVLDPQVGNFLQLNAAGLYVPTPATGGSTLTASNTSSVNTTIAASVISSIVNINPIATNKLSSTATGLLVLPPTCSEVLTFVSPTSASGCIPAANVCALPTALIGHVGGAPSYYSGKPLYTAEVYPTTNAAQQTLSNTGSTLNDITSLMTLIAGDENGLCPGEASFWDPALSRFTITRPGRYTYHWGLFMRLIMSNSTLAANNSLYAGVRFIRPAGVVNGRSVSAQASTLRGTQFTLNVSAPAATQDWESTGSHTFIATAGTQLSLRAVAILGSGSAITSFIVRGDSGHFSLSELPDRQF